MITKESVFEGKRSQAGRTVLVECDRNTHFE